MDMENTTIVIVGVGALGSHLVQFIRNLDVNIRVVDFDRVEQRNVMSQFHGKPSVGKLKSQSLQQSMKFMFKRQIDPNTNKLTSQNAAEILGDAFLIVDCLDNGESRRIVQRFVRERGIPCLHGALAADGDFGQVVWDADFQIDDEDVEGAATCEAGEFLPFITLVSSLMATAVQQFIQNGKHIGFSVTPVGGAQRI